MTTRRFRFHPSALRKRVRVTWGHPANEQRRMRAVVRLTTAEVMARLSRRPFAARLGRNSHINAFLHQQTWTAVMGNPPDFREMVLWRRLLRPGDLFVDVGANAGLYTIWLLDLGCEVIAIEPASEMIRQLRANLNLNGYSAIVIEAALAESGGTLRLDGQDFSRNHLVLDGSPAGVMVDVLRLDDIVGDRVIDGVKIDVEGAERLVLEGGRRALAEQRLRVIQLEWNHCSQQLLGEGREKVAALLTSHGYRLGRPSLDGTVTLTNDPGLGTDIFAFAPGVRIPT